MALSPKQKSNMISLLARYATTATKKGGTDALQMKRTGRAYTAAVAQGSTRKARKKLGQRVSGDEGA